VDALRDFGNPAAVHPRLTHFEKHTAIARFFYDTPFTLTGKSHGSVSDQFKKRTQVFLSQARGHAFPSHLKRLPVSQRVEVVLTPLQCVLEDIHKCIAKLRLEARPALGNRQPSRRRSRRASAKKVRTRSAVRGLLSWHGEGQWGGSARGVQRGASRGSLFRSNCGRAAQTLGTSRDDRWGASTL